MLSIPNLDTMLLYRIRYNRINTQSSFEHGLGGCNSGIIKVAGQL